MFNASLQKWTYYLCCLYSNALNVFNCFNARIYFSMNLKPFLFCIIFTTSFVQRFLTDVDLLPYVVCIQILVHVKIVDFVMLCDIPFENVRPEFIVLLSIKLLHSPCCHSASQTQKCSTLFLLVWCMNWALFTWL